MLASGLNPFRFKDSSSSIVTAEDDVLELDLVSCVTETANN